MAGERLNPNYVEYYTRAQTTNYDFVPDGAGAHNATYRGKELGTATPTEEQYAAISSGKFTDMFIGDYWKISDVTYRIAAFDYFLHCGDTECKAHHVTLVPDGNMATAAMDASLGTSKGYVGTSMYTTTLPGVLETVKKAFPDHVLKHKEIYTNASQDGHASGYIWTDSEIELMNENMVYGTNIYLARATGTSVFTQYTLGKGQLPLFAMRPDLITIRSDWWLRDIVSAADFAYVYSDGTANSSAAPGVRGVRPDFSIS